MKTLYVQLLNLASNLLIASAILFLLIFNLVVKGDSENTYDLVGYIIPHPPLWTSFIPYLGFILEYIFSLFSLHGLLEIIVVITLVVSGLYARKTAKKLAGDSVKKLILSTTTKEKLQRKMIDALEEAHEEKSQRD
jgi:hypothetical protein